MKITIQPDPANIDFILANPKAQELAKDLLLALKICKKDRESWEISRTVEIDPSLPLFFEDMQCFLPEPLNKADCWFYSIYLLDAVKILLINGESFWAKTKFAEEIEKIPDNLINLSCRNWPNHNQSQNFIKFNRLKSIDLSFSDSLINLNPLKSLTHLNSLKLWCCEALSNISIISNLNKLISLDLSNCNSLNDLTPIANLNQLSSLELSHYDSMPDLSPLANLSNLTSLDISYCNSLIDITLLKNCTKLTSLNLSECESLSDISALANLTLLTSLDMSFCKNLQNINALANFSQLNSLNLSCCESLTDIRPLANLKQLTSINLGGCYNLSDLTHIIKLESLSLINISHCGSVSDLSPLANLKNLQEINFEHVLRATNLPRFKTMVNLAKLESYMHPIAVADILAHCALSRKDWAFISKKAEAWTSELESALKDSHPAALDLATSLAIALPHISFELSERLCQILQTDGSLDYRPWKQLFLGVFRQMGFKFLQNLASTIAAGSWPRGAIGGLAAIAEQLITLADGKEWFAGWVLATSAQHESNPSFLKPVAAPWCLALHCLGENVLLDQWIARFTDPDDSTALDAVFLEFGNHRLGHNDAPGAFRHAMRIRATLVRDGLLADIASHYLEAQQADQAAELLFLLSAEDKRAELSLKLADIPHFLDNRDNLHCLLAACGKNAPAIGKLLAKAGMDETVFPSDADDERQRAAQDAAKMASIRTGLDAAYVGELSDLITQFLKNKAYTS